jgi:hypothetical protein
MRLQISSGRPDRGIPSLVIISSPVELPRHATLHQPTENKQRSHPRRSMAHNAQEAPNPSTGYSPEPQHWTPDLHSLDLRISNQ